MVVSKSSHSIRSLKHSCRAKQGRAFEALQTQQFYVAVLFMDVFWVNELRLLLSCDIELAVI